MPGDGPASLEGGPALHPAQVRRMACEASVTVIVERNGEPTTRSW
jgi:alpha-tubulin suppressor-like RCC1 family protein